MIPTLIALVALEIALFGVIYAASRRENHLLTGAAVFALFIVGVVTIIVSAAGIIGALL